MAKSRQYGSTGHGLSKHRKSGRVPRNHTVSLACACEENRRLENKEEQRKKHKGQQYASIKDMLVAHKLQ